MGAWALATDRAPQPGRIAVHVKHGDWGTARIEDIEQVLISVADVLAPHFPQRASDRIVVEYNKTGPRVLIGKSREGARRVLLNVQDTRWDQFAYQFSHELCHIFTNFEHREIGGDAASRDHQWFEEALCEAVSLLTLNRLATSWERSPPRPRWDEYAPAFREYAERLLSERHRYLPAGVSVGQWYKAHREQLYRNAYFREKNEVLATRLLALLESTPGSLQAIGFLNLEGSVSGTTLKAFLESWYECCPEEYKGFVREVIALLDEGDAMGNTAVAPAPVRERPIAFAR